MDEPCTEGLAIHGDPDDALATREGAAKRSRWHVQAGLLRLEIREFGVLTPWELRKATSSVTLSRAIGGPRAVEEPMHHLADQACTTPVLCSQRLVEALPLAGDNRASDEQRLARRHFQSGSHPRSCGTRIGRSASPGASAEVRQVRPHFAGALSRRVDHCPGLGYPPTLGALEFRESS